MMFQCFVCDKTFNRTQDRNSHLRLKRDDVHKQYLQQQQQQLIHQFSTTVEAATAAANISSTPTPVLHDVLVQWNDVDQDDMPLSSWNMDVDTPEPEDCSDDEHSIISNDEVEVVADEDVIAAELMAATTHALGGFDLDDIAETFNFLPDSDLDETEDKDGPGPSYQHSRRTLIEIEAEKPTYRWHQTAGQVYGQEPMIHARWQALFNAGPDSQAYKPFRSRLDWEIAQWAVKEKIPQKSFNRLLNIPEVPLSF